MRTVVRLMNKPYEIIPACIYNPYGTNKACQDPLDVNELSPWNRPEPTADRVTMTLEGCGETKKQFAKYAQGVAQFLKANGEFEEFLKFIDFSRFVICVFSLAQFLKATGDFEILKFIDFLRFVICVFSCFNFIELHRLWPSMNYC